MDNAWKKGDAAEIFWKYILKTLELLKIHNKSVKISRFSPKYSAIFSFLSQVCCLVTPTFSFVLKIFSKYFGGIALLSGIADDSSSKLISYSDFLPFWYYFERFFINTKYFCSEINNWVICFSIEYNRSIKEACEFIRYIYIYIYIYIFCWHFFLMQMEMHVDLHITKSIT